MVESNQGRLPTFCSGLTCTHLCTFPKSHISHTKLTCTCSTQNGEPNRSTILWFYPHPSTLNSTSKCLFIFNLFQLYRFLRRLLTMKTKESKKAESPGFTATLSPNSTNLRTKCTSKHSIDFNPQRLPPQIKFLSPHLIPFDASRIKIQDPELFQHQIN